MTETNQMIAVAVVEVDDRILIGQRPPGASLAGFWEFPGGKVQAGESTRDAAVRECREETGLDIAVTSLLAQVTHAYDHGLLELYFFQCQIAATATHREPFPPFLWVRRDELARFRFPAANDAVVAQLVGSA